MRATATRPTRPSDQQPHTGPPGQPGPRPLRVAPRPFCFPFQHLRACRLPPRSCVAGVPHGG
eukprot:6497205-Lingulodinium_polyedra.AAC.1